MYYTSSVVFQGRLELVKKEVEQGLAAFFAKKRQEAKQISPHCLMLADSVAEFTMRGGKRTRAFLCWLGYHTAAENTSGVSLRHAMMGLELFQSFALIHDDIIDKDTIRRGGPTVHEQLGVSMAILAGDLAFVWADELMGDANTPDGFSTPEVRLRLRHTSGVNTMRLYHNMNQEVIFGQSLDVLAAEGKPSADRATINRYKTAWYSVIRPIQIGAAIGGAGGETLEAFVPYGLAVGEAYQLRDDFLDRVILKDVFDSQARKLQKRAAQAIKKLKISKSVTMLLVDFANFALHRSA